MFDCFSVLVQLYNTASLMNTHWNTIIIQFNNEYCVQSQSSPHLFPVLTFAYRRCHSNEPILILLSYFHMDNTWLKTIKPLPPTPHGRAECQCRRGGNPGQYLQTIDKRTHDKRPFCYQCMNNAMRILCISGASGEPMWFACQRSIQHIPSVD